jgi:hypothetical protein
MSVSNLYISTAPLSTLIVANANILSGVIDNIRINYANIGILDVGTIGNGVQQLLDGSASNPSLTYISNLTTGLYLDNTTTTLNWVINSNEVFSKSNTNVTAHRPFRISNVATIESKPFKDVSISSDIVNRSIVLTGNGDVGTVILPATNTANAFIILHSNANPFLVGGVNAIPNSQRLMVVRDLPTHGVLEMNAGNLNAPAYSFIDSPTSGIYLDNGNSHMTITYEGQPMLRMDSTGTDAILPMLVSNGNVLDPGLGFINATSTGFFNSNSNIGVSVQNGTRMIMSNVHTTHLIRQIITPTGNVNAPSLMIGSDSSKLGLFTSGDNLATTAMGNVVSFAGQYVDSTWSNTATYIPSDSTLSWIKTPSSSNARIKITTGQDWLFDTTGLNQGIILSGNSRLGISVSSGNMSSNTVPLQVYKPDLYNISGSNLQSQIPSDSSHLLRLVQIPNATETGGLTAQLRVPTGNLTTPSYSFLENTSLGLYAQSGNVVSIASQSIQALSVSNSSIRSFVPFLSNIHGFVSNSDCRMTESSGLIQLVSGSSSRLNIGWSNLNATVPIHEIDGSDTSPSYSFSNVSSSGMYLSNGGDVNLTRTGNTRLTCTSTGVVIGGLLTSTLRLPFQKTSATSLTLTSSSNTVIECTSTSNVTITLPALSGTEGLQYIFIKRVSPGNVIINTSSLSEFIDLDGTTQLVLTTQSDRVQVISTGSGGRWYTI